MRPNHDLAPPRGPGNARLHPALWAALMSVSLLGCGAAPVHGGPTRSPVHHGARPSAVQSAQLATPQPQQPWVPPVVIAASPAHPLPAHEPTAVLIATAKTFFVAGCNVECVNCTTIDRQTYVTGHLDDSRLLYGGPRTPSGAYTCSGSVAPDTEVTLRAQASASFEFVQWRKFGAAYPNDYCPCDGSTDPTCRLTIDASVISQHSRAYCGAVWRLRSAPATTMAIAGSDSGD